MGVKRWSSGGYERVLVAAVARNKGVADRYKKMVKDKQAMLEAIYFNKHGVKTHHQYKLFAKEEDNGSI